MALTQVTSGGIKDSEVKNADMADDSVGIAELSATGTAGNTTYLRGDNTWTVPPDTNTTYTHPNHSGEVTSAGDGATTITDDVVDEANLKISNAGSNGQYLQKQSGNTGGLTWATVTAGGGGATGTDYDDNVKVRWGTDNDLAIYHSGSHAFIENDTGEVRIKVDEFRLLNNAGSENMIDGSANGDVNLYYNGNEKLATTDTGILVTGNTKVGDAGKLIAGDGDDLQIYHDATNSRIHNTTGELIFRTGSNYVFYNSDGTKKHAKFVEDGAVELYHNNSKKFETLSSGITVTGYLNMADDSTSTGGDIYIPDVGILNIGNGNDLKLYHNGTDSYIESNTGALRIGKSDNNRITDAADNTIIGTNATSAYLNYDGNTKLETQSLGVNITGNLDFNDDGKVRLGTASDLQIYHDATDSHVHNKTGALYLSSDDALYLYNEWDNEYYVKCAPNAAVEIYYNGIKKFETYENGSKVIGQLHVSDDTNIPDSAKINLGTGADLQLYHDGSHSRISAGDGGDGRLIISGRDGSAGAAGLQLNAEDSKEAIMCRVDGSVDLYHNGTKTCETSADGLAFPNGKGINFNATPDGGTADSELLDDYEEGTWTPSVSQGSATITAAGCNYTKIGRMVYLNFHANNFTDTSTDAVIRITGLPFTPAQQNYGACAMVEMDHLGGGLASKVGNDGADLIFVVTNVNYSQTHCKYSSFDASTNFIGASIAYVV